MTAKKTFGGAWSDKKLDALNAYLNSYALVLKKSNFTKIYIDAFAGAGKQGAKANKGEEGALYCPELFESENDYRHGSPLVALEIDPPFDQFVFIDEKQASLDKLREQVVESGHGGSKIQYRCADANDALLELIGKYDWRSHRAVAFLDPFAFGLKWETIQAIAQTKAIDMWLLFPAMAVNRMLPRSGDIPPDWQKILTYTFGSEDWKEVFYQKEQADFFGDEKISKVPAVFEKLSRFVTQRLEKTFAGVHKEPLVLRNSTKAPIFLFCFACGNDRAVGPALRIANHIINQQS